MTRGHGRAWTVYGRCRVLDTACISNTQHNQSVTQGWTLFSNSTSNTYYTRIKTRHDRPSFSKVHKPYGQSMQERKESPVQKWAYPHRHLLLMTTDKLLMQIPSEQLQLPHPQPSPAIPCRKVQPRTPPPPSLYTCGAWAVLKNSSERALVFKTDTIGCSSVTWKRSDGTDGAGGDCVIYTQPNTCSVAGFCSDWQRENFADSNF